MVPSHQPRTTGVDRSPVALRPGLGILAVSFLLVIPCFWQSRIQAGDFGTHVYNAWLATRISQGAMPGLWIAPQSNNVLFDITLQWLLQHMSLGLAQGLVVSVTVLVFAWGAILFISAAGDVNWWLVVPSVAMLAYGFIFHMGFFNFYLSMGLCLWYLAIFWRAGWRTRVLITPLLLVAWTAHPLPVAWALGAATYLVIAAYVRPQRQWMLFLFGILGVLATRFVLSRLYVCAWSVKQALSATGADQLLAFGPPRRLSLAGEGKYVLLFVSLLAVWLSLLRSLFKAHGFTSLAARVPLQLWVITAAGALLIPDSVALPQYPQSFTYINHRLSLAAAVMGCAVLSSQRLRASEKIVLSLVAVLFFGFVYADVRVLNQGEDRVSRALKQVPLGQRVIGLFPPRSARMNPLQHALDRGCIDQCFSYADYEPPTRLFRVRAGPDNGIVLDNYDDVRAVHNGTYVAQRRDLPLYLLYLCGESQHDVCWRSLREGEEMRSLDLQAGGVSKP
jgi:hypothetical protein